MNITELKNKAKELIKLLEGSTSKVERLSYDVDKETFLRLHKEAGEPTLYPPSKSNQEYWFIAELEGIRFIINYKAKSVLTYEAL